MSTPQANPKGTTTMTTARHPKARPAFTDPTDTSYDDGAFTFPVIVRAVIGEVTVSDGPGLPPHVAAFHLIAEHDTPGDYEFPMAGGGTCHVTVAYETHESAR